MLLIQGSHHPAPLNFFILNDDCNLYMTSLVQKIHVFLEADDVSVFWSLLSYGIKFDVQTGGSLLDLLICRIGINERYLNEKVQTIFLNGKVVDDFNAEIVKDESVIALSAAMPGLVGAVFRKGGILSSMRSEHLSQPECKPIKSQKGQVTLKLFNLIASDLGAGFYKRGICISGKHFIRYVKSKQTLLETICKQIVVDGKRHEVRDLLFLCQPEADIVLTVNSA